MKREEETLGTGIRHSLVSSKVLGVLRNFGTWYFVADLWCGALLQSYRQIVMVSNEWLILLTAFSVVISIKR